MKFLKLFNKKSNKSETTLSYFVAENVVLGKNVTIGHGSYLGYGEFSGKKLVIGDNVTIGAFCLIHFGSEIGNNCDIDDYCKICPESKIGENTKILYGKHVYNESIIGSNCIIGGHVADRTVIEDNVTYMGEIAHSHRHPDEDWNEAEEPSPTIRRGSVVGVNALLIGGIEVGPCAYIGAGEIVRVNVPADQCFLRGIIQPLKNYRGMIKSRCS